MKEVLYCRNIFRNWDCGHIALFSGDFILALFLSVKVANDITLLRYLGGEKLKLCRQEEKRNCPRLE